MPDVRPIPDGFHTITPYLIVNDAAKAIDYYRKALGAEEVSRHEDEQGGVRHAEIRIGDSMIMLTEETPAWPEWKGPLSRGGTPVHLYVYVSDADRVFQQAIEAGANELMPMQDQAYGDRSGGLTDPFGHVWYVATHVEDVTPEEMKRREEAARV